MIINQLALVDYPIGGYSFTWSTGRFLQNMDKLDRFLGSLAWDSKFPNTYVKGLATDISHHFPIILYNDVNFYVLKCFKFEKMWFIEVGFKHLIISWWITPTRSNDSVSNFSQKIRNIDGIAQFWCKEHFFSIRPQRESCLVKLKL